jgi:hypothetical protein
MFHAIAALRASWNTPMDCETDWQWKNALSHVVSICRGKYLYSMGKSRKTGANRTIEFDAEMQP